MRLPFAADPEQVQASFENGILTVTVPKTGRQERSRRIQVQGGGATDQGAAGGTGQQATDASGQSNDTRSG